jgi:hypothetical protein
LEDRWAVSREAGGYQRLTTDDTEYATFVDVVSEVGYQLSERAAGMGTLLNYREPIVVATSEPNADAGTNTLTIQGPGDDEAWVIEKIAAYNANHVCSYIFLHTGVGSAVTNIGALVSQPVGVPQPVSGPVHVSHDHFIEAVFLGCTAGDDLYLEISGYIMDLVT